MIHPLFFYFEEKMVPGAGIEPAPGLGIRAFTGMFYNRPTTAIEKNISV